MLIVLDTSAVTRDARFETFVRDALDHGSRVLVPRLVLVEVAHRYQRESVAMIDALTVQARMYDRLGLREDLSVFVDAARAKADGYVDSLARQLEAMGCDVIEPAHTYRTSTSPVASCSVVARTWTRSGTATPPR